MAGRTARILVPALVVFFFQAEDGIRDLTVTGVQTCALPIFPAPVPVPLAPPPSPATNAKPASVKAPSTNSARSEEHTSELQSQSNLVCRLLLEKKNNPRLNRPPHHRYTTHSPRVLS